MIPFYCTTKNINETDNFAQFLIDTTTYKTVKIGTVSGFTYGYIVNWGDGTVTSHTTSAIPSHTYSTDGDKTITIAGRFPAISYGIYGNTTSEPVLKEILSCKLVFTGTGLTAGFRSCSLLTNIPYDMFYYSPSVTTFYSTFRECAALAEIPEHLFDKNLLVAAFYFTFSGCTGLTAIPTDLFKYNTQVSIRGFCQTFINCTGITAIPTDLFRYNTQVSTEGFYQTFNGCTALTSIPADLFKYNTQVSIRGFYSTFYGCSALTSIPSDLFKYNTQVSTEGFYQTFYGCVSLTSIPTTIDFLGAAPIATTNVARMFRSCSGITGSLAEFWNLYDTTSWTKTDCYSGCINATNYAAAQAAGFAA